MDNKAMRYQFVYEGSVTACAALWAALVWFLANLKMLRNWYEMLFDL